MVPSAFTGWADATTVSVNIWGVEITTKDDHSVRIVPDSL